MGLSPQVEVQLEVVVDVVLVEVHQLLLQEQEIFSCSPGFSAPLHLVDCVLLDECVCGTLAIHTWQTAHQHVLGRLQQKKTMP